MYAETGGEVTKPDLNTTYYLEDSYLDEAV